MLGLGNGPPTLSKPYLMLLGRQAGPAQPNQPPLPPNADRDGTARALPQQRGAFLIAGLRLCYPRQLAPPLPRHSVCFLREPTFWTRERMGYGGLEKLGRAQPRTRYTWSAFWTTRGRLNFLFPQRATRLRREPYGALGACKFTSPARFLGEFNVT